jgi:hypothetical protein
MLVTRPFFLYNLIWLVLESAMERLGQSRAVTLVPEKIEPRVLVRIMGLDRLSKESSRDFPEKQKQILLNLLEAQLNVDFQEKAFILVLPESIKGDPGMYFIDNGLQETRNE